MTSKIKRDGAPNSERPHTRNKINWWTQHLLEMQVRARASMRRKTLSLSYMSACLPNISTLISFFFYHIPSFCKSISNCKCLYQSWNQKSECSTLIYAGRSELSFPDMKNSTLWLMDLYLILLLNLQAFVSFIYMVFYACLPTMIIHSIW